jgi:hypothetical protein
VSVKGGDNVSVAMVRDLGHVVDREKAKIGVFITLAEPTGPMKTEAIKAGYYETEFGQVPENLDIGRSRSYSTARSQRYRLLTRPPSKRRRPSRESRNG